MERRKWTRLAWTAREPLIVCAFALVLVLGSLRPEYLGRAYLSMLHIATAVSIGLGLMSMKSRGLDRSGGFNVVLAAGFLMIFIQCEQLVVMLFPGRGSPYFVLGQQVLITAALLTMAWWRDLRRGRAQCVGLDVPACEARRGVATCRFADDVIVVGLVLLSQTVAAVCIPHSPPGMGAGLTLFLAITLTIPCATIVVFRKLIEHVGRNSNRRAPVDGASG